MMASETVDDLNACLETGKADVRVYHTNDGEFVPTVEFSTVNFTKEEAELRETFTEVCGDMITQIAAEVVDDYSDPDFDRETQSKSLSRVLSDAEVTTTRSLAVANYLDVNPSLIIELTDG